MQDMTYNMAAEATRHVALILDNDEDLYRQRLSIVASRTVYEDEVQAIKTADALREWCEELCEDDLASDDVTLAKELLFYVVLPNVDWLQLARDYIEEEEEEEEEE